MDEDPAHRAWLAQWTAAAPALAAQRRSELAALTPARALVLIDTLLSLAGGAPLPERRRRWSGLVEQQRVFARGRR